jgi:formiminoglutamase
MDKLDIFNNSKLKKLLNKRSGESKFGEHVQILTNVSNIYEQLKNLDVTYVIIGLPEDVGIFANYGKPGAYATWDAVIKILVNIQNNKYINAKSVLILGHLNFENELNQISTLDQSKRKDIAKAREVVANIDEHVTNIVHKIVKAGKKPIIIGGGHNNAYGNIKGSSLALNTPINTINLDAHSDFRKEEGRHSGNGFSYAFTEGFLKNYFIFGLHENYTSDVIFNTLDSLDTIQYNTFESIFIRHELKYKSELQRALKHVSSKPFGIEIDCDAIENIPSSAMTPTGFTANKTRTFLNYFAKHDNAIYLHICEAAPNLGSKKMASQTAKLITYLITDFIHANTN